MHQKTTRGDALFALILACAVARLYYATGPAQVNLDGLGYVKLLPHNFAAGHLLYMPLLRLVAALCRGNGLLAGRLLSAGAAGLSVGMVYLCARAFVDRFASTVAAAGLAVSYAVWIQGGDVEAYSCALAAAVGLLALAIAYRARPGALTAFNLGLALGGAVLFHLTHVLLTPFVIAWCVAWAPSRKRGLVLAALASSTGGVLTLACYAFATFHVRHTNLAGAIKWVATAGHGFRYDGTVLQRLADSLYGLAKAFVWSPYLYESNQQHLLAQFVLGLGALVAVGAAIAVGRRAAARLPWRLWAVWIAPYVAMALLFFGSDHERWLFVLPPIWILAGAALSSLGSRRGARWAAAIVAYLAVANAATAVGPARHECWDRTRADAAAALMRDGDLVLFPGHSWDEYIGFYTHTNIIPFPIAYYAGRDGKAAMIERLRRDMAAAEARHSTTWVARVFDDHDDDSRGFYELSTLGFPVPELRALFDAYRAVPSPTVEPKVTIWRLERR